MKELVIMRYTLGQLRRIFFWPKNSHSTRTVATVGLISASFLMVTCCIQLALLFSTESFNRIQVIQNVISQLGVIYFGSSFLVNQDSYIKIVDELSDFKTFGKPPHFELRNKQLDRLGRFFVTFLYTAIAFVLLWPIYYTQPCKEHNLHSEKKEVCGLIANSWLPFDFSHSPYKELVYLWQCYSNIVILGSGGLISIVLFEIMEHIIIKIQHLKMLIHFVVDEKDLNRRQRMLVKWVHYHWFIYKIAKDFNTSVRSGLLVHMIIVGILFGFIGYTIKEDASSIDAMAMFYGYFSSFSVACIAGQDLQDKSASVAFEVYNSKWYLTDANFRKDLFFIMMRSQKQILINAGPFGLLSHLLILGAFQTAYSYVSLLNATS